MPYHNEQAVFVWFDESGENIAKIEEMFDAAFMDEFLPKFHHYMAEKMQRQAPYGSDIVFYIL
jgi:hypothetical protein